MVKCLRIDHVIHHIMTKGKEKYTIISSDAVRALGKVKIQFPKEQSRKPGLEGKFITLTKGIYKNSIANIILNGKILTLVPLKPGTRRGCLHSPLVFDIILEAIASVPLSKRKQAERIKLQRKK